MEKANWGIAVFSRLVEGAMCFLPSQPDLWKHFLGDLGEEAAILRSRGDCVFECELV